MLFLSLACFVPLPEPAEITYDAQGLPACEESFTEQQLCQAITHWVSTEAEGFTDGATSNVDLRWAGTEVQPAFCSDDAAEAEAWVLAQAPDGDGSHKLYTNDARWWDLRRYDAEGALVGVDRIMRCSFVTAQAATPPGIDSEPDLMVLTPVLASEPDTFFPMAREMSRWRKTALTVQAVVAYGEATVETETLRVCSVRCGECGDIIGPTRNFTAVLESQDWVYDPARGTVSFTVGAVNETECQGKF